MQSRNLEICLFLIFNEKSERNGHAIWTQQKVEKVRYISLCLDDFSRLMEFDGRQVWIASLFDNTMRVFNVFTPNIYNLQGAYIYDSQCFLN